MGIQGLSTFVNEHRSLGKQQIWTSNGGSGERFVIDGNAFVFHYAFVMKADWAYGGQYASVVKAVEDAVRMIQQAGITPMFLFDGALPSSKLATRIKRYRSYIGRAATVADTLTQMNESNQSDEDSESRAQYWANLYLIPPLTLEVCVIALCNLGVEVILCENEADGEVVLQAKKHNGFVVSKDSDMHVYPDIGKGYIPIDTLQQTPSGLQATVFCPQSLASLTGLRTTLLPLFGSLLGNDYLDGNVTKPSITRWCNSVGFSCKNQGPRNWPKYVARFLCDSVLQMNDADVINAVTQQLQPILRRLGGTEKEVIDTLESRIVESVRQYDPQSPLLSAQAPPSHSESDISLSIDMQNRLEKAQLGRQVMDVIRTKTFWTSIFVEDLHLDSSWNISRPLRQCLYRVVLTSASPNLDKETPTEITEYVRDARHLASEVVEPTTLAEIESLLDQPASIQQLAGDIPTQAKLFLRLHHSDAQRFETLPRVIQPLVLCLRFFIYHSHKNQGKLANHEMIGILVSSMKSLAPTLGFGAPAKIAKRPNLKKRNIHITAQWQGIIFSSYLLAQILGHLQAEARNVLVHAYDGLLVHHSLVQARQGANLGKLLEGTDHAFKTLFCNVYKTVTASLEHCMEKVYDYDVPQAAEHSKDKFVPGSLKKKVKSGKIKKRETHSLAQRKGNAFDLLSFGCSFDA